MKYIFLAFFVFIASLPVQASGCDMHEPQEMSHGQHGDMQDSDTMDMDCCDHDPEGSSDNCDPMSRCNTGVTSVASMVALSFNITYSNDSQHFLPDTTLVLNSFYSPPFRPPIA